MAQHPGKDQYLVFAGLTLTNSLATEITFSGDADEIDASTINSNGFRNWLQGVYGATMDCNGIWDDGTATTGLMGVLGSAWKGGGTQAFAYAPGGSVGGRSLISGNMFVTKFEVSGAVDGVVGFSSSFRVAGSVAIGAVS